MERDILLTQRELIPLTTGLIADVKRKRTQALREKIRTRRAALIKIQAVWRGALCRWHIMLEFYADHPYAQ